METCAICGIEIDDQDWAFYFRCEKKLCLECHEYHKNEYCEEKIQNEQTGI